MIPVSNDVIPMNLSSRLALFFAPLLLIGYLLIAFSTYESQRAIALSQAQTQLEALVSQVQSGIHNNRKSLLNFLGNLPPIAEIMSPSGNKLALENTLEAGSIAFGRSLSLAILAKEGDTPFRYRHQANDSPAPDQDIHQPLLSEPNPSNWRVVRGLEPAIIIVAQPVELPESGWDEASLARSAELQVAMVTDGLTELWNKIEHSYEAELNISPEPIEHLEYSLAVSRQLETGEFLNIRVGEDYVSALLKPLLRTHFIGFLLLFLATLFALSVTVRRQIGMPLKMLAADLSDLYRGETTELKESQRNDEIGALANSFSALHQELTETYEQSRILAEYDPLTSLPNRSSFYTYTEETLRTAALYDQEIRLLYIDLDNYKQVNDKFGHDMGDELLVDFSRRLTRTLHNKFGDGNFFAARLAGDEFAVVLPPDAKEPDVNKVCRDILKLFDGGYWFARGRFAVTLSIGIASYPSDGKNVSELVSNADLAMYQAKEAGKNQTAVYSEDLAARSRYLDDLERELRRADFDEEFHLSYMPIFDSKRSVVSCEALLRWNSPQLGDVSPADFVPVAETCGLFVQLDRWVIQNAFSDFRRLRDCFGPEFRLAINLSSAELQSNDILSYIKDQFSLYGIQPSSIEFEMTETFAISQHLLDGGLLYKLAELGVHISLDDFGTGFTSMLQLVEYPIETIKLDRTFISRLMNSDRQNLLPALVDLCHAQNLQVTAEGVESQKIAEAVLKANCDCLQGYHLCKPKRLEELEQLYKKKTLVVF